MTTKHAFRIGFLRALAERGMTPEDFGREMSKRANGKSEVLSWVPKVLGMGFKATIGVPILAGGVGGLVGLGVGKQLAAWLTPTPEQFALRVRTQEVLSAYERATRRMKDQARTAKKRRKQRGDPRLSLKMPTSDAVYG